VPDTIIFRKSPIFSRYISIGMYPGILSEQQQLCFFDDIDYAEEVSFLPGYEVSEEEVKTFLTELSTDRL
jgi:hypothetical protein